MYLPNSLFCYFRLIYWVGWLKSEERRDIGHFYFIQLKEVLSSMWKRSHSRLLLTNMTHCCGMPLLLTLEQTYAHTDLTGVQRSCHDCSQAIPSIPSAPILEVVFVNPSPWGWVLSPQKIVCICLPTQTLAASLMSVSCVTQLFYVFFDGFSESLCLHWVSTQILQFHINFPGKLLQ